MKKLIGIATMFALAAPAAVAQCAMCYESASQAGAHGQHVLDKAILVLLIPPVTFMGVLLTIVVKHRGYFSE